MPGESPSPLPTTGPLVILGAGYAGVTLAQGVWHRTKGSLPVILVDQSPLHVLRTELYEIGKMALVQEDSPWALPLETIFDRTNVRHQLGRVQAIDLVHRKVKLDSADVPFGTLAICLGSQPASYGVPGALVHAHQVYGLEGARRLARAIREVETASVQLQGERRPRFVVIGGGATGAELAADLAMTDWPSVTLRSARAPEVLLVPGALPFLLGLPPSVQRRVREMLQCAGVGFLSGINATGVEPRCVLLEDGTRLVADLVVWAAGVEAPELVRALPVPHGRGGRISVSSTLEVPGHRGIFAVGDVAEVLDPVTGLPVPQTAQAAIAEARTAAYNVVALQKGTRPRRFRYQEMASILALGSGRGAASVKGLALWGRPASWLKKLVQTEYARSIRRGEPSPYL